MAAKPLQDSHHGILAKALGACYKALTNRILKSARRHSWFWIPLIGVTVVSALFSSIFLMGGIITNRIEGQTEITIALFCTGAAFIIVPPAITLAILKSASPSPPAAENG